MSASQDLVPRPLAVAAAWSWRIFVVVLGVVTVAWSAYQLRVVTVPLFIATLLTTVLVPPVRFFERRGLRSGVATLLTFVIALVAVVSVVYLLSSKVADQLSTVGPQVRKGVEDVNHWLVTGPLHLDAAQIDHYYDQAVQGLKSNSGSLRSGIVSGATVAVELVTGLFVTIVLTVFLTKDGENLFKWWVSLLPRQHQEKADRVGRKAWHALGGYLRGVAFTGLVDALTIGAALLLIGVPLVLPLVLLTFFGAFLPVVGATVAGLIAVLIALVNGGVTDALLVLAAVLAVQQIEGHILQPLVMSRAVSVHPVAILLTLATFGLLAGVVGAFMAVPLLAVTSTVFRELWGRESPIPIESETEAP